MSMMMLLGHAPRPGQESVPADQGINGWQATGVWIDEYATRAPKPSRTYGPPVKGRGGKVKRW